MEEAKGGWHCLGTATLWKGEAMVSVNFDQGVEGGKGLKGKARRRGGVPVKRERERERERSRNIDV